MSPYCVLLLLNLKYDMKVMVDKKAWNNLDKYFTLEMGRKRVGVLEDNYWQQDIDNMKENMLHYRGSKEDPNSLERDFLEMRWGW